MSRNTCWRCEGYIIWGNDFSYDEVYGKCDKCTKDFCDGIVSFLSCNDCNAEIEYINKCEDYIDEE